MELFPAQILRTDHFFDPPQAELFRTFFDNGANKVELGLSVAIVSILPHAEFGPNDHRDAPHL